MIIMYTVILLVKFICLENRTHKKKIMSCGSETNNCNPEPGYDISNNRDPTLYFHFQVIVAE